MNKPLKTLIIGALALAGAWCASADPVGVTVNGTDVSAGSGDGWTFAGGLLSLTSAQDYVLAGTNTAGAVRVEVTAAGAAVTLRDLKLVGNSYVEGQIEITKNAHLVLEGVNTVYSPVHLASIILKKGCNLTLDGPGELVGDPTMTDTQYSQRALWIVGTLVINGGTIRDYKNPKENGAGVFIENGEYLFTMNGGVITNCHAVSGVGGGVYTKGPFTMNGGLIVDCRSGSNGGGVYNNGRTFTMNGGTIKNCRSEGNGGAVLSVGTFTMNGGTISGNVGMSGGALFNTGTARIYGGTFQDNTTTGHSGSYAGAIFDNADSHTYIYGGYFSGNKNKNADNGTNLYMDYYAQKNGRLYGGVFDKDPTDSRESHDCLLLQDGATVTQVGDLYVVGKRVAEEDYYLTGGTYTFCPTNEEYATAGLEIADDRVIHAADTTPKTYAIGGEPMGVTVNGMDVGAEAGDGWAFEGGILSLTGSQSYVIAGGNTKGAVRVEVTAADATVKFDNLTLSGLKGDAAVNVLSGAKLTLPGDGMLTGNNLLFVADGGAADVLGGVFNGSTPFSADDGGTLTVYGCVSVAEDIDDDYIASGYECKCLSPSEGDELYVVGKDVKCEGQDTPQLMGGTYTFCPTNAEYVAAYAESGELLVKPGTPVTKRATTPVTWVLGVILTYPDYLAGQSYAVTNTFNKWANTYGSRDPDGVYTNAFLLNVATNREAAAVAAFKIESIVVTNSITYYETYAVTNGYVADIVVAKPIDGATMYNGKAWLQCVTNDLSEADWLDIEDGRYTEGDKSFFTLRIGFEHKVTPEAFPKEPTGSKTVRVYQH